MPKKLLIVSYAFPPRSGIGGRRWAKFSKYLSRKGYELQVLAAENIGNTVSEWNEDIKGIKVKYLPYKFPKIVSNPGKSLLDKVFYKLMVNFLKLADKGNYFDRSLFWKSQVQKEVSYFIEKENYNCVIVTAGPFRLAHHVTELKQKYPRVKFIVDFRDLWTEDSEITSFSKLSQSRKIEEKKLEKETVYYADKVITVAPKLSDYFDSLTVKNKTELIPNGFDTDDYKSIISDNSLRGDKIKFVFTGTLYINLDYILKPFFEGLKVLKMKNSEVYKKIDIEFIGNFPQSYVKYVTQNELEVVTITDSLPLIEVYKKINNSNFCLLFLNDVYSFALSTKFCEYISQKRKIAVVSSYGAAAKFIEKNKIGFWIDPKNTYEGILKLMRDAIDGNALKWETQFDINDFSLESLTERLIDVIESDNYPDSCQINEKNLLLTFDYELYLGSFSGTVENCLIKPTNKILEILKQRGIKHAIFFVDTTYLIRIKDNPKSIGDQKKITEQLVQLIKEGHYIFPHIHPHWKDAVYDEVKNQWTLNNIEKYRFHNIDRSYQVYLFEESIKIIQGIQKLAGVFYPIDVYRAGGWCLQPFSDFKPFFEKYSIKYDFSVLKGFRKITNEVFYDYTEGPKKPRYNFNYEVDKEDKNGAFTEFTISSLDLKKNTSILNKAFNKYLWLTKNRSLGDGMSIQETEEVFIREIETNNQQENTQSIEMASLELLTLYKMRIYKNHLKENDYLHVISHPKMVSEHNLKMFDTFLKYAKSKYELNTNYTKMSN